MKFSEHWLREWANPAVDTETLCAQLTMAGLEVDGTEPAAPPLVHVVVAKIESVEPHPDADKLQVCRVAAGQDELLQIVCGAPNAAVGLVAPLALPGAHLPGDNKVKTARLRGVESSGMLCSAAELGLGESAAGLLALDPEAPVGQPLTQYLQLGDTVIEVDLTPNRGDCLSIRGIAREVGVWNRCAVTPVSCLPVPAEHDCQRTVVLDDTQACPVYAGRVITGIDPAAHTPSWLQERLRRSGVRPLSAIVDVTNYIMLELGQPMHAFDNGCLQGEIHVRPAVQGEDITLLDGTAVTLQAGTLVIADNSGPVAMAGIMGGLDSAVGEHTDTIFLESAFFTPAAVAGQGSRYKRHSEALHRFERGVDPTLQAIAIERATTLIQQIAGGTAGPVTVAGKPPQERASIGLRHARIGRLLGSQIEADEVVEILQRLDMQIVESSAAGWQVTPPAFRFDIAHEADLIEEVARLHGYDNLPARARRISLSMPVLPETELPEESIRQVLQQRGYAEAVTYSFVDAQLQAAIDPRSIKVDLDNPIAAQHAQMRTTLWSSLLPAWLYNLHRQQSRVRLYEIGLRFERDNDAPMGIRQQQVLAGVVSGAGRPTHWQGQGQPVEFFDVKGDIEALLALSGKPAHFQYVPSTHVALHPGRSADIVSDGEIIGRLGQLHPRMKNVLNGSELPFVFELMYDEVVRAVMPRGKVPSEYPEVRRDLALVVPEALPVGALLDTTRAAGIDILHNVGVFDVFRGAGLEDGCKSVALNLIFQHKTRTLEDEEVDSAIQLVRDRLAQIYGAEIRGQ